MVEKKKSLGHKLKTLRKIHGLTGDELAAKIGYSQASISKVENGLIKPPIDFTQKFVDALGLVGREREDLLESSRLFFLDYSRWEVEQKELLTELPFDLWKAKSDALGKTAAVNDREAKASLVREYHPTAVPGLYQSPAYTKKLFVLMGHSSPSFLERELKYRRKRQDVLKDESKTFKVVLSEAAFLTGAFPAEVMQEQADKLKLLTKLPNVDIRLLPHTKPVSVFPMCNFAIYDSKLVVIDSLSHETQHWTEEEVALYSDLFDKIVEDSEPISSLKLPGSKS